jgi:flagellar basal-body rod protein FlgB
MNVTLAQFDMLGRLMDAAALRHHVIAHNMANVNTPGYRRLEVSFEETFGKALRTRGEEAAASIRPRIVEAPSPGLRRDGSNLDVDRELGGLNKNALVYAAASQILQSRVATMRSAITGR